MIRRRNLLLLGIGLDAVATVMALALRNHMISYSTYYSDGSLRSSTYFSVALFAIPFGLVGFWLIMWAIFGRDFRGYRKSNKEES